MSTGACRLGPLSGLLLLLSVGHFSFARANRAFFFPGWKPSSSAGKRRTRIRQSPVRELRAWAWLWIADASATAAFDVCFREASSAFRCRPQGAAPALSAIQSGVSVPHGSRLRRESGLQILHNGWETGAGGNGHAVNPIQKGCPAGSCSDFSKTSRFPRGFRPASPPVFCPCA